MPRGIPRGRTAGKQTQFRHRRTALVAAPVVTALAIGAGMLTSGSADPTRATAADAASSVSGAAPTTSATPAPVTTGGPTSVRRTAPSAATEARTLGTSRSVDRVPLVDNRVPKATGKLWTTEGLDLRTAPAKSARTAGLLQSGKHVTVTGRRSGEYAEVIVAPLTTRWVTADYLAKQKAKPKTPEVIGLSDQPCPDGSSLEGGLQPQSVKVYRAVCAAFPELSSYGGQDGHGEHVNGEAIDFMVPSSSVGERVKDFVYAHRAELDLFDIIWSQRIWTIERAGEGFRSMSDRGSASANHFDHVHIKIN